MDGMDGMDGMDRGEGGIDWVGCCDPDRGMLVAPFVLGGVRYATNGKILVAAKTDAPDDVGDGRGLPSRAVLEKFAALGEYAFEEVVLAQEEGAFTGECGECRGTGKVACRECHGVREHSCVCGDRHTCGECAGSGVDGCAVCGGEGRVELDVPEVDILGVKVAVKYLRLIVGGKPRFCRSDVKGLSCVRFRCEGGEQGIIMAVVPTNTIREEENGQ